jgi:hypothetical protein
MTIDTIGLIRCFFRHVLPSGFQKVRHSSFLETHAPPSIAAGRRLVTLTNGAQFVLLATTTTEPPVQQTRQCEECGGQMRCKSPTLPHA